MTDGMQGSSALAGEGEGWNPSQAGESEGWNPSQVVAIDWSGARGTRYRGIAVATCGPGDEPPVLVTPPSGWWSRTAVHDWLSGLTNAVVGIDCAFSLPFAVAGRHLPPDATAFTLWDRIEGACAGEPDFGGAPFVDDPVFGPDFWTAGRQPGWYTDPHRGAEWACRRDGLGEPQSPYKLIGAKQVGRGALAGMRMLRALRAAGPGRVAVWPFDTPGPASRLVLAEIYPRLFLMRAGFGRRKLRDGADLDAALAVLGSRPMGLTGPVDDHASDALVSAAGMRRLLGVPGVWAPPALDEEARRREGWIFGAGLGGAIP
ncbi:hypothetical protein M2352_001181 [Azospirillum fermentarium]|uniref:hypothetical protein n=1 Tax=Azospirillum fermentarium TaxID=1233114 RepID=UPI0022270A24|nr:hypothetical protein [Azospirillum fermentarium]MCW2245590.1 hypothetical protein [Azospirillum fermentarium]